VTITNDYLSIASDYIKTSIEKSGIQLTHNLEAYLSITFARHIDKKIEVDRLTVRVTNALDKEAPRDILRELADECLISCSLFEGRLRRYGVVRYYVGLGQMTYDAAGMTEQAYGFTHMRDVISYGITSRDAQSLIDSALSGSVLAKELLLKSNVVVGPWARQKWLS